MDVIHQKIFEIRGQSVILDLHIAELFEVETKVLKQSVKRNLDRFLDDFGFEPTMKEYYNLRSQFVTSGCESVKYAPFALTE